MSQLVLGKIQLHILWKVILVQKMNSALQRLKEFDIHLDIEIQDAEQEKMYIGTIRRVLLYDGKSVLDVINVRDGKNVISGQENIEMTEDEFLKMGSYIVSRIKESE